MQVSAVQGLRADVAGRADHLGSPVPGQPWALGLRHWRSVAGIAGSNRRVEAGRSIRLHRRAHRFMRELVLAHVERHRSEEHTSELQSLAYLVCRLLLEKKK